MVLYYKLAVLYVSAEDMSASDGDNEVSGTCVAPLAAFVTGCTYVILELTNTTTVFWVFSGT